MEIKTVKLSQITQDMKLGASVRARESIEEVEANYVTVLAVIDGKAIDLLELFEPKYQGKVPTKLLQIIQG